MKPYCLNCENPLNDSDQFCAKCGQSRKLGKLSVLQIIKDIFGNIFNLDAKVWKSMANIFVPGKLTIEYVAGRRVSYLNPGRFFVFMLIVFVAIVLYLFGNIEQNIPGDGGVRSSEQFKILKSFDTLIYENIHNVDSLEVDSLRMKLFDQRLIIDTLDLRIGNISFVQGVLDDYDVSKEDIVKLDSEYIIDKYNIEGFFDKMKVRQSIRIYRDMTGVVRYFVSNIFWFVILMTFSAALIFKLIYIRNKIYLTEHLVHSTYIHTFGLIAFSIGFGVFTLYNKLENNFIDFHPDKLDYILYIFPIFLIYAYLAIKFYYQQGWIKTFIKFIIITILYVFTIILVVSLIMLASVLLF